MKIAPLHPYEDERLKLLSEYDILDTDVEMVFDDLAKLASLICQSPIALVSIIDKDRQWFKAVVGLDVKETSRDVAFCSHALLQPETMVVPDTLKDERFVDNPLVTGAPGIRFYAGAQLVTETGLPLGTLCVIDRQPKQLSKGQEKALRILSNQAVSHLEARRMIRILQSNQVDLHDLARAKNNLFGYISHELRTPFSAILGLSELLVEDLERMDKEEINEHLVRLRNCAYSGQWLLENLLDMSLIQSGMRAPEKKNVHLDAILLKLHAITSGVAVTKGIQLALQNQEPLQLVTDPRMLFSVFQNLVTNSIKFTPSGGTITVRSYRDETGDLCVDVQDTGYGLKTETVALLNAGGKVEATLGTAGEHSTGLGLILCREFSAQIGARLFFESVLGKGTRVTVRFPG